MSWWYILLLAHPFAALASANSSLPRTPSLRGTQTACPGCRQCVSEGEQCSDDLACCDASARCEPILGGRGAQCVLFQADCVAPSQICGGPGQMMHECCDGSQCVANGDAGLMFCEYFVGHPDSVQQISSVRTNATVSACPGCHQCASDGEQCSDDFQCCDGSARCEPILGGIGAQCVKQNAVVIEPGHTYRFENGRFGQTVCLDNHQSSGSVAAFPCDNDGGDEWMVEGTSNPMIIRLTNARFGSSACLDRHLEQGSDSVGAYPCDVNGGDEWTVEATAIAGVVRLRNGRFGNTVCLDRSGANAVEANPCDDHGGNEWTATRIQ